MMGRIIPKNMAIANKVTWSPPDEDEPDYQGITGIKLTVVGQTEFHVKLKSMRHTKVLRAIVCKEWGDELFIDLDTLISWSIISRKMTYLHLHPSS